jgi:hypothetical protein
MITGRRSKRRPSINKWKYSSLVVVKADSFQAKRNVRFNCRHYGQAYDLKIRASLDDIET